MPNNRDFSKIKDIKTIKVNPNGWISPLYVEYGQAFYDAAPAFFWRVKGTRHTFVIQVTRMDFLSQGDYVKHFNESLEVFAEDYKEWAAENFIYEWQKEYRDQYAEYISV